MRGRWLLLLLAGCGLEIGGTNNSVPDGAVIDTGIDGGNNIADSSAMDVVSEPGPPQPCSTEAGACTNAVPMGWSLVAYAANRSTGCPANYQQVDLVTDPVAGAGTCDCACMVGTPPVCDVGTVSFKTGAQNDPNCMSGGVTINVNGPGCQAGGGTVASHVMGNTLAPSGGTCTGNSVFDKTKITSTGVRACRVPPQCQEDFCQGKIPQGFQECITKDGKQTCPPGWDSETLTVGADVSGTCSACSCDVNGPSTCTNAKMDFWANGTCSGGVVSSIVIDNKCNVPPGIGQSVDHFKYSATLKQVCNTTGPKTAAVDVTSPSTVCCK